MLCFLLSILVCLSAAAAAPLDGLLARADLWTLTRDTFPKVPEAGEFGWTSSARDSARAAEGELTLLGLPVFESVLRFEGATVREWMAAFYARGDAGDLPKEKFELLLKAAAEAVSKHTGTKFTVRGKDLKSAVKAEGLQWQTPQARYLLEYSFTREVKTRDIPYRAEFIRLSITPPERSVGLLASAANMARSRFSGVAHVQRDLVNGDVFLRDIPMVDQGDKGYCAVACAERVLRYYGTPVDANELAQVASSDAEAGTSADAMMSALKKLGTRLRVRIRPVEEMEVRDWLALIEDYNRAAKRGSRAPAVPDPGRMLDVGAVMGAMKPDLLREVRNKGDAAQRRLLRTVQTHVDQGIPVLWGVMLGMFPEPGVPQSGGGHMRLLTGYNVKKGEVLFSDSWGAGHELKRMPIADAWTITTGMTTIEPL